jgi:hypothetical protein
MTNWILGILLTFNIFFLALIASTMSQLGKALERSTVANDAMLVMLDRVADMAEEEE